jgi:hypothetical protein
MNIINRNVLLTKRSDKTIVKIKIDTKHISFIKLNIRFNIQGISSKSLDVERK